MKHKKTFSFIFYFLILFTYLSLFKDTQSNQSLMLFIFTFLLLRKLFIRNLAYLESKLFFLTSLFIYETVFPINIHQSLTTIQMLILSRKNLLFSLSIFLSLFILFLIYQNPIHLSYIHPSNLAINPIKLFREKKEQYVGLYDTSRDALNRRNIKYLVSEIPRHGYIRYTSQYNLPNKFFTLSKKAIEKDENIYIILSKTGSPASEVISLFTHKDFNHLSLSFDRNLKTMVSYNGGNKFQNPGLNTEDLNSLQQKMDSHVLVYSLKATKKQQSKILSNIRKINNEGSAYNVLGLLTSHSVRPNMMFCSQFVYTMFQQAGLTYFDASHGEVKPTDFIENDCQDRLTFEYEIANTDFKSKKQT